MSKSFLESKEVFVVKGYLSSNKTKVQPIYNSEFIAAQKNAEWAITFAAKCVDKDFKGKAPDSLEEVRNQVREELSSKGVEYVAKPTEVKQKLTEELKNEALAWLDYQKDTSKTEKINQFMQKFNVLYKFEEVGLFFEEDVIEIKKIYTVKEILDAVTSVIDLL